MIVRTTVKSIQDIMRQDVGVDGDAQRISQLTWMFFLKIIDDQDQELELTRDGYRSPIPKKYQWRNWAADPEGITGQALLDFINDELFPALKGLQLIGQAGRPPPRGARRVRGRLQLHEIRPAACGRWSTRSTRSISTISTSGGISASSTSSCSTTCNRPAMRANIIRRAPSPPSWSTGSTRIPAKSCSIPPAARAAFSPAPSATWRRTTSKHPSSAKRCRAPCAR